MPAGEIIKPRLSFSALLYRPAKVGQFLRGEESIFLRTLSRAGAAFGVGRAVMLNGCSRCPGRHAIAGQNRTQNRTTQKRTRPPPCMRWRGPCLAAPRRVGQLPGLPSPAGPRWCRTPAPGTGFPIPLTFPESPPGRCPFPTVKVFLLRRRMERKSLRQSHGEFFAIHILSTEISWLSAVSDGYPPVYAQPFHRLPLVIRGIP